jgi:hypothetical protein
MRGDRVEAEEYIGSLAQGPTGLWPEREDGGLREKLREGVGA